MRRTKTSSEAARELGISLRHLYRLLHKGTIPEPRHEKVGSLGAARMWTQRDIERARRKLKGPTRGSRPLIEDVIARLRAENPTLFVAEGPIFTDTIPSQFVNQAELLTPLQLAERLQVSSSWIYEQIRSRTTIHGRREPLPFEKHGRRVYFHWDSVVNWLRQQAKGDGNGR